MDVITVPAWMLCVKGWGRGGCHHGSGMDDLLEQMVSGVDFIAVLAWMLCMNEWGRCGRYHGSGIV